MLSTLNRRATLLSAPRRAVRRNAEKNDEYAGEMAPACPCTDHPISTFHDDDKAVLEIDLPGMRRDEIELSIEDGQLRIRGNRKPPKLAAECRYNERRFGRFERVVVLDKTLDLASAEATLTNGVLRITLATKPESRSVRIEINSAKGTGTGQPDH